jgi:hypothetical protein
MYGGVGVDFFFWRPLAVVVDLDVIGHNKQMD